MTYTVSGGALNSTQSNPILRGASSWRDGLRVFFANVMVDEDEVRGSTGRLFRVAWQSLANRK